VYVVSESGTIRPSKKVDTLKAMPLLPGGPIIIPSCMQCPALRLFSIHYYLKMPPHVDVIGSYVAEVLQSLRFLHLALSKETGLVDLGRWDKYLSPYYEKDLREGKITHQEAAELLGCLYDLYSRNFMTFSRPATNLTHDNPLECQR
jgi:hypothetical protein